MPVDFNHAGLYVSDIDASTHFYRDLLGRPNIARPAGPPDLGSNAGIRHIGFKTDDLDGIAARLKKEGVTFKSEPRVAGSGIGRLMFVYDPDFNEVEIIQRDVDW